MNIHFHVYQPRSSSKHVHVFPSSLSVTRWYCIKTAERIVMLFSPHDSPFILVFTADARSVGNSQLSCRRWNRNRGGQNSDVSPRPPFILANFGVDRFRGFSVARGQILGFSIGFRHRPYNTLALVRRTGRLHQPQQWGYHLSSSYNPIKVI